MIRRAALLETRALARMLSRNSDRFDHDDQAAGYDAEVLDEQRLVRAGYDRVLRWVAARVPARPGPLLELGIGTGNLAARLDPARAYRGVDLSREMLARAADKLAGRFQPLELVRADLLGCLDEPGPRYAAVVSTYAVHHLEQDEKALLFRRLRARLLPGGRALFGDLMFASAAARAEHYARWESSGRAALVAECEDEFYWHVDRAVDELRALGFAVEHEQLSELSWGLAATLPDGAPPTAAAPEPGPPA